MLHSFIGIVFARPRRRHKYGLLSVLFITTGTVFVIVLYIKELKMDQMHRVPSTYYDIERKKNPQIREAGNQSASDCEEHRQLPRYMTMQQTCTCQQNQRTQNQMSNSHVNLPRCHVRLPSRHSDDYRFLYVDNKHQLVFCAVPKVASTTWKVKLIRLQEAGTEVDMNRKSVGFNLHDNHELAKATGIHDIGHYSPNRALVILKTFYKAMFVRDPWERLLSAYRDKFIKINRYSRYFHMKYGRRIIKMYRKNATKISLESGADVRFPEFVKFVRRQWKRKEKMDPHWAPMVDICQPCLVQYDFIGKYETFSVDSYHLLNKILHRKCNETLLPTESHRVQHTKELLTKYYDELGKDDLQSLKEIYHNDFQAFGYEEASFDRIN